MGSPSPVTHAFFDISEEGFLFPCCVCGIETIAGHGSKLWISITAGSSQCSFWEVRARTVRGLSSFWASDPVQDSCPRTFWRLMCCPQMLEHNTSNAKRFEDK